MSIPNPPGLAAIGAELKYVFTSHAHEDHQDRSACSAIKAEFPVALASCLRVTHFDYRGYLGDEPFWLIGSPKHSWSDIVIVFRGVAMTGDIELGQLASVNREVPADVKRASMEWLRGFQGRTGYHVHTAASAHFKGYRRIDWTSLFTIR